MGDKIENIKEKQLPEKVIQALRKHAERLYSESEEDYIKEGKTIEDIYKHYLEKTWYNEEKDEIVIFQSCGFFVIDDEGKMVEGKGAYIGAW